MTASEFLNKVRDTLDADLQRWKFSDEREPRLERAVGFYGIAVEFLGTGDLAVISFGDATGWVVSGSCAQKSERLLGLLQGKKRDEAGVLR